MAESKESEEGKGWDLGSDLNHNPTDTSSTKGVFRTQFVVGGQEDMSAWLGTTIKGKYSHWGLYPQMPEVFFSILRLLERKKRKSHFLGHYL